MDAVALLRRPAVNPPSYRAIRLLAAENQARGIKLNDEDRLERALAAERLRTLNEVAA